MEIDLPVLLKHLADVLPTLDGNDGAGLHARCTAAGAAVTALGPAELRRAALALSAFELPAVRPAFASKTPAACVGLALETPLLTPHLLRQSVLRREEFARKLIAALGATVRGESAEQSEHELHRLDYARVLADAERAKFAADQRLDWLRQLQIEQDRRQPRPRGKWW